MFRDGDSVGVDARKAQLDDALVQATHPPRGPAERIATPVPTWAIENWLLDLLGQPDINEARKPMPGDGRTWKQVFELAHASDERGALLDAANRWRTSSPRLPSLADGVAEFVRIEQ